MKTYIKEIIAQAESCSCGNKHFDIPIEEIIVGAEALPKCISFLKEKSFHKAAIIADERTFSAVGERLKAMMEEAGIKSFVSFIEEDKNGDVVADEASLVQALNETPRDAEVLIAAGSGTLHDITRFCSDKTGKPFISIPTAASVDGFTSMGAPIIVRGTKKTFQTVSPIAVFADLEVLKNAPMKMTAAGFGDMLAKVTSLADWKFSHLIAGEPYCPLVAQMTREALDSCIQHADEIAKGDEKGIEILINGLILSGLAMLLFGQSHPASGGEHHLSHFWEMEFLREGRPQVLHGAKVAVSMPILADLYKRELGRLLCNWEELDDYIHSVEDFSYIERIKEFECEINSILEGIPSSDYLRSLIEKVGGATRPEQLGISNELVVQSLNEAHSLRDRFTMLKFLNVVVRTEHKVIN
ncbi:sn-glycerol-1-phosphate dehydrogenase [Mesobacillus foraminis]|uniref:sn-glycerol-1-phosphate dehydrogenase n=1 Tax=Mesobacillus foraminis TaxID=279826 RepID=UPI000EF4418B|nr:sn-glycerol-1-phosphate dehydrogenase [Mesobacillus foraminis]